MKKWIPNIITGINLFCGCIAVLSFIYGFNLLGIILILSAAIADFLDGFVARLLNVSSPVGKELDSLADMVSFGFVPGTIIYLALLKSEGLESFKTVIEQGNLIPLAGFIITVFSGFRLAKFNVDTRQSNSFIGLPTPANTLFFLTIPLIWMYSEDTNWYAQLLDNSWFIIGITILFSFLLIAELPLIALKFKGFGIKENKLKYLLILIAIGSIAIFGFLCIPVIICSYLTLSIFQKNAV